MMEDMASVFHHHHDGGEGIVDAALLPESVMPVA
jgi:hypothetical protein